MEPFRIEFRFQGPVAVPSQAIHLDALLAYARFEERVIRAALMEEKDLPDSVFLEETERLPLEKETGKDGQWCWKASALEFVGMKARQIFHYTRPFDIHRWMENAELKGIKAIRGVNVGTGQYKAFSLFADQAIMEKAVCWCVGEKKEILRLIRDNVSHIGKHKRIGKGRIASVEIFDDPEATQNWKRRTLPVSIEGTDRHFLGQSAIRAPYWSKRDWAEAQVYAAP